MASLILLPHGNPAVGPQTPVTRSRRVLQTDPIVAQLKYLAAKRTLLAVKLKRGHTKLKLVNETNHDAVIKGNICLLSRK